jgi:hypothetical protein
LIFGKEELHRLKTTISNPRRQLLRLIANTGFGRIENLDVQGGEPVLDPSPRIVREIRLGSERSHGRRAIDEDLLSRPQVIDLLRLLSEIGDGTMGTLEIQNGLPFRVRLDQPILPEAL